MARRDFLGTLPALGMGAACGGALVGMSGCGGFRYVRGIEEPGRLVVDRGALQGMPDVLVEGGGLPKPVYLRETEGGGYSAVLVECTHRGCQPEPEGDRLVCPCHGSEFRFTGEVLGGPASRPLTRFRVSEEGSRIMIWLSGGGER